MDLSMKPLASANTTTMIGEALRGHARTHLAPGENKMPPRQIASMLALWANAPMQGQRLSQAYITRHRDRVWSVRYEISAATQHMSATKYIGTAGTPTPRFNNRVGTPQTPLGPDCVPKAKLPTTHTCKHREHNNESHV